MPAYPRTQIESHRGSQVLAQPNVQLDLAADGTVRGRVVSTADEFDIDLVHRGVTADEAAEIEQFYLAHRDWTSNPVTFDWRDLELWVHWREAPEIRAFGGGASYEVNSRLVGVLFDELGGSILGGDGEVGQQVSFSINFANSTIGDAALASSAGLRRRVVTSGIGGGVEISEVSANAPRFEEDAFGNVRGIKLERGTFGARILNNTRFETADGWTHTNVSLTYVDSILGGTNAAEVNEGTAASVGHNVNRPVEGSFAAGTFVCVSAIVQYADMPFISIMFRDRQNAFPIQQFNIHPDTWGVADTIEGGGSISSPGMEYLGDNWFRIWAFFDPQADGGTAPHVYFQCNSEDGTLFNYTGTNRSFVIAGAMGHEAGFFFPQEFFTVDGTEIAKLPDRLTLTTVEQLPNNFFLNLVVWGRDGGSAQPGMLYKAGDLEVTIDGTGFIQCAGIGGSIPGGMRNNQRYNIALGVSQSTGRELWCNGILLGADPDTSDVGDTSGTIWIGTDVNGASPAELIFESIAMGAH